MFPPFRSLPISPCFQQWLDSTSSSDARSLSPHNNSDFSSAGGSPPLGHINTPISSATPGTLNPDDEVIPTAIVIKNIPFNVKRETLLDIIVSPLVPFFFLFPPDRPSSLGFAIHSYAVCFQLSS